MRRPSLLVALALIAGPAIAQPPPIEPLVARWRECVVQSFKRQRIATPDASMAAEAAFIACQTEENAFFLSRPAPPDIVAQYRVLYRAKLKGALVAGQ
jgi:hypothetical protein